jgi:DNA-binding HxlR family transcriptional regulator
MRAGTYALSLLSTPLNGDILEALEREPKSLVELRRAVGSPPPTTMRAYLRAMTELGALEKRRQNDFPGSIEYALAAPGRELLTVAHIVSHWLARAADGPIEPGTVAAKSAIKALIDGWSASIVRALAARALSLTELDKVISKLNYPSIERRLSAMRAVGQIESLPGRGRSTPYAVTDWLRRAVLPIAAAARWERRHAGDAVAPISGLDVEAVFLLSLPLLRLSADRGGYCRLAVELPSGNGNGQRFAGVLVGVEQGRVASCVSRLDGESGAWAAGSPVDWMEAVAARDPGRLELGGDRRLATNVVEGLHGSLFGVVAGG